MITVLIIQVIIVLKCDHDSNSRIYKMMGVIVVVCAAFGLTVSETKTETMC